MTNAVLSLDEKLDLRAAGALRDTLLERRGADLTLDASQVTLFGTLAVQVLRSAAQSWAEAGHHLSLTGVSTDGADQLFLLGFTPETLTIWEPAL